MASVEKKPRKGILKSSSSFDKAEPRSKEMKWDEMNILATHHPPDKDYGHMKIDEPPTPYSKYSDVEDEEGEAGQTMERRGSFGKSTDVDPSSLSSRLEEIDENRPRLRRVSTEDEESSEEELTEEELEKKRKFKQKRKQHYNEFQAVQLAKQLMAEEEDDDDDEDSKVGNTGNVESIADDGDNNNIDVDISDSRDLDSMQTDQNENPTDISSSSQIPGTSSVNTGHPSPSATSIKRETQV